MIADPTRMPSAPASKNCDARADVIPPPTTRGSGETVRIRLSRETPDGPSAEPLLPVANIGPTIR